MSSQCKPRRVLSTQRALALRVQLQMAEHKQRVGRRLREARDAAGLTQVALARLLPGNVDAASVSRWERGDVYPEQYLDALAEALDRDVAYFLTPDPEPGTGDAIGALSTEGPDDLRALVSALRREVRRLASEVDRLQGAGGRRGATGS